MPKTGVNVLIKVDGEVVGGQRGATFNTEMNTIDATHKPAAGWAYNLAGQGSWSIDCDGIVLGGEDGSDEERMNLLALHRAYKAKRSLAVEFNDPTGLSYSGQAIMTSLPIEAPMDDVMTWSTSFQGQGEYDIEEAGSGGGAGAQSASTFSTMTAIDKSSTKDDIKSELDKYGVQYTESETKDELLKKLGDLQK